jgi:hypothetical protein
MLFLALAEQLTVIGTAEIVTFDTSLTNQAKNNAPTVKVNLLIP